MDFSIASILALDGVTNGAVYALLALATVLVFAVTRVIFIPQGEFVAFGALTLALFQTGKVPGTVWFVLVLAALAAIADVVDGLRHGQSAARIGKRVLATAGYWWTSSTSFANPAVTLARTLTDSFSGIRASDAPAFVLMQLLGAGVAVALSGWLMKKDTA